MLPTIVCVESTIMVVIGIFAVKAHLHTGPARQFRLSSVILIWFIEAMLWVALACLLQLA